jgi:ribosome biogenesis GTPase
MLEFDFEALAPLGLTPALAARAVALQDDDDAAPVQLVRVVEVHRETLVVHDGTGERTARMLPKLARSLADEASTLAAGDWATCRVAATGERWLAQRVPPTSHIARRDGDGRRHAIVSNVDVALLVMGLDEDFNPRRLERFLALVHQDGIVPVVVLTKRDIAEAMDGDRVERCVDALQRRLRSDVALHPVDATRASAADALRDYCTRGTTLVMLGSSGAGKSTLTNTLLGDDVQDTGIVREHDGRGRHTTTSRSLHRLPGGACVIDTPGVRTLRPDADEAAVAASFEDVDALSSRCRFPDCRHESEPGCAVRGVVDDDRLRNYRKLLREIARDAASALDRQRQVAAMKVRGRAVRERMKWKRGATG